MSSSKRARRIALWVLPSLCGALLLWLALSSAKAVPTSTDNPAVGNPAGASPAVLALEPDPAPPDPVGPVTFAAMAVGLRDDWLYATAEDVELSMSQIFAADHHSDLRDEMLNGSIGSMREALATAPTMAPTWYMTVPLTAGLSTDDHTTHEVTSVEVWEMQVFSRDGVSEPTAAWSLHTLTLVPEAHSWLVTRWTVEPGPAPGLDGRQTRTDAAVVDAMLQDHTRLYRQAMVSTLSIDPS